MSLQAEWGLARLLGNDDDPFDAVITSTGITVDLRGTEEEVFAGIQQSLRMEGHLFNAGVTCDLKDGGQDCLTCPEYVADREEEERAPLCRLGRDQRLMEQRMDTFARERREAPLRAFGADFEGLMELVPAL